VGDAERISSQRQEMSEEFSQLEATLTEAARQGNISHVIALLRDTGRLHHLWQVHSCPSYPAPNVRPSMLGRT